MVKGASGNLQKEKIINKRKHAGRRPIGIKYFEARMVYRLLRRCGIPRAQERFCAMAVDTSGLPLTKAHGIYP